MNTAPLRTALAFALTAAVAAPAFAADTFTFDAGHTYIGFEIDHLGFSKTLGEFQKYDGTLNLDRANLANSSIEVTIDTGSIDTDQADFDEHLKSADFFNVAAHPTMTFKSTKVEDLGNGALKVTGDFTMLGQTRRVVLDAKLNKIAPHPFRPTLEVAGFSATTTIDRTQWGFDKYAPAIGAEVKIRIETEFNRELPKP
jgi:polyisoprenoid-binding protein YceI